MWQQVVVALGVVVLQRLPVGEVVGGEGQAGGRGQRLPVHPHRAAEARHCGRRRQHQDFNTTTQRTNPRKRMDAGPHVVWGGGMGGCRETEEKRQEMMTKEEEEKKKKQSYLC